MFELLGSETMIDSLYLNFSDNAKGSHSSTTFLCQVNILPVVCVERLVNLSYLVGAT
jgi:hypothetical protein